MAVRGRRTQPGRRAIAALLVWLCLAPAPSARGGGQDEGEITLASDLVLVPVAARREKGGAVTDLTIGEFSIAEDGVAQEVAFCNHDTAPVDVVLLVDTSESIEGTLEVIQSAAFSFVKQLRPEDRFSIVSFADRPVILLDWSDDRKACAAALRSIEPGGNTALYGSVVAALYERFEGRPPERRRAAVVLTDGDDTISSVTSRSAARAALLHDASVYVVSTSRIMADIYGQLASSRSIPVRQRAELRERRARLQRAEERLDYLADQTGGRTLYPAGLGDLSKAYGEIAEEIRSRYLLGYYPSKDAAAGFHTISVATRRKGVRVHARQGYFKE